MGQVEGVELDQVARVVLGHGEELYRLDRAAGASGAYSKSSVFDRRFSSSRWICPSRTRIVPTSVLPPR